MAVCDHMLVYLNSLTWTHDPDALVFDIKAAQHLGVHLQGAHEFPSVLDGVGSLRGALEFDAILRATPEQLTSGQTNIYKEIAIGLKGGAQRNVGLELLAQKLLQNRSSKANFGPSDARNARKVLSA